MNFALRFFALLLSVFTQLPAQAAPINWQSLQPGMTLKLLEPIALQSNTSKPITLTRAHSFHLDQIDQMGEINVTLYTFTIAPCGELANETVKMTLVHQDYGFELAPKCQASVYVEFKDLFQASLFE